MCQLPSCMHSPCWATSWLGMCHSEQYTGARGSLRRSALISQLPRCRTVPFIAQYSNTSLPRYFQLETGETELGDVPAQSLEEAAMWRRGFEAFFSPLFLVPKSLTARRKHSTLFYKTTGQAATAEADDWTQLPWRIFPHPSPSFHK